MQDSARPHTARLTTVHLRNMGNPVLPWPSKSQDMDLIEHLLDEFERRDGDRPHQPTSLDYNNLPALQVCVDKIYIFLLSLCHSTSLKISHNYRSHMIYPTLNGELDVL